MTQQEFKEILESIEVSLYGKWLKNFKEDPINKGDFSFFDNSPNHDLIDDAFEWDKTPEGWMFWKDVEKKFIKEREKRNLD